MWDALAEICTREGLSVHALCTRLTELRAEEHATRAESNNFTSRLRVFILDYYRRGGGGLMFMRGEDRPRPT